ncbi:MAG TPA: class I SAM-dependent methyltransferase [Planctomycetes bacterium]|nr:class I SAM-dependent methyltransferase [Planctomycetota bacterium]
MTQDRNPQAEQMAHESMLRTLAAQAEALWPQELPILRSYDLPAAPRILDVGCGSGEATRRIAAAFPDADVLGVDVHAPHIEHARSAAAKLAHRVTFRTDDAYSLSLPDDSFDLVLCRHVLQAIPDAERVLEELRRVTRPGGRVHLVAEDYAMLHFHPTTMDLDRFFLDGPVAFGRKTGTDLLGGRRSPALLRRLGFEDVRIDYATLDTERVPRSVLARIFRAWQDGYTELLTENTPFSRDEVTLAFDEMVSCCEQEDGYAVWHLPIVSGRIP